MCDFQSVQLSRLKNQDTMERSESRLSTWNGHRRPRDGPFFKLTSSVNGVQVVSLTSSGTEYPLAWSPPAISSSFIYIYIYIYENYILFARRGQYTETAIGFLRRTERPRRVPVRLQSYLLLWEKEKKEKRQPNHDGNFLFVRVLCRSMLCRPVRCHVDRVACDASVTPSLIAKATERSKQHESLFVISELRRAVV